MGSRINIKFTDEIVSPCVVAFKMTNQSTLNSLIYKETFYTGSPPRTEKYKIPIPTVYTVPGPIGSTVAKDFEDYWKLDYNSSSAFLVSRIDNIVSIIVSSTFDPNNDYQFELSAEHTCFDVEITLQNKPTKTFKLNSAVFGTANATPCSYAKITLSTTEVATTIKLNGILLPANTTNPFVLDIARGISQQFYMEAAGGANLQAPSTGSYFVPTISQQDININISQTLGGATITVSVAQPIQANPKLIFEYSINGTVYQASETFTGQAEGANTLYVRDQFGCTKTKAYEVTAYSSSVNAKAPYFYISRANSINYSDFEVWDGQTIFKNDENLLAHQGLEDTVYCQELLFTNQDSVKTQVKTTLGELTAVVRDDAGNETPLIVDKMSNNLDRFKQMDAWYYKYEEGYIGVYFQTGNTYDEFGIVSGEYTLNGNLPDFAIRGQVVELEGLGIMEIYDVVYDPILNKYAIILEYGYNGVPTQTVVKSIYDVLPFEVYEFIADWSLFGNGLYDILVTASDPNIGTFQKLSENILIEDAHPGTLAINYYNHNNRDIFYKYGMENFIRVPYLHIEGVQVQSTEINIADFKSSIVTSSVHEADRFYFEEITKLVARKLVIALSCETVFINGIGYVKNGDIESENVRGTNLYLVSGTMLKTNVSYNNKSQGKVGVDAGSVDYDIPPFFSGEDAFLK